MRLAGPIPCALYPVDGVENVMKSNSDNQIDQAPGISGKRMTFIVLLGLLCVGGFLCYTLWAYTRFDEARQASTVAWRELTEQLAIRYRAAETIVAQAVDSREVKMEFGEKFQLAVERFRTTARTAEQFAAAQQVEDLLGSDDFRNLLDTSDKQSKLAGSAPLLAAAEEFNACRSRERSLLDSSGGQILDVFLRFESTEPFVFAN